MIISQIYSFLGRSFPYLLPLPPQFLLGEHHRAHFELSQTLQSRLQYPASLLIVTLALCKSLSYGSATDVTIQSSSTLPSLLFSFLLPSFASILPTIPYYKFSPLRSTPFVSALLSNLASKLLSSFAMAPPTPLSFQLSRNTPLPLAAVLPLSDLPHLLSLCSPHSVRRAAKLSSWRFQILSVSLLASELPPPFGLGNSPLFI